MDVTQEEVGGASTQEQEEANRFYKWVKRTRAEYKSLMGGKSSRMLTEERVAKLRQIAHMDDEKWGAVSMIVVSGQIAFTACVSCGR
eukprot:scaffold912_cov121-Skeletonema_dohrnii-CCMP3373.AAC.13